MTRTGKKLLAAAALSTLAAPGVAFASPGAAPTPPAAATRAFEPPDGCMVKLWDPATKSYWYVGNGKSMPDQASVAACTKLQAVMTANATAAKAPVNAPYKMVSRAEFAKAAARVLYVPAAATPAVK